MEGIAVEADTAVEGGIIIKEVITAKEDITIEEDIATMEDIVIMEDIIVRGDIVVKVGIIVKVDTAIKAGIVIGDCKVAKRRNSTVVKEHKAIDIIAEVKGDTTIPGEADTAATDIVEAVIIRRSLGFDMAIRLAFVGLGFLERHNFMEFANPNLSNTVIKGQAEPRR